MNQSRILGQLNRQKYTFTISVLLSLIVGVIAISSLPEIYQSESRIEIANKTLFNEYSGQTISNVDDIARRFYATRDAVLSNENVKNILEKHALISVNEDEKYLHTAILDFKRNVEIEFIQGDVINPYSGKEGKLSIGIEIQFENESPIKAQEVTQSLTQDFLKASAERSIDIENKRIDYLTKQLSEVKSKIDLMNAKIVDFKRENSNYLPELQPLTLNRYNELLLRKHQVEENLTRIKEREGEYTSDLSTVSNDAFLFTSDGTRMVGNAEKLMQLEVALAVKEANFSDNHPDIIRLRKEVNQLKRESQSSMTTNLDIELIENKKRLNTLNNKYSETHPDILRIKSKIASLEKQITSVKKSAAPSSSSRPNNPAYVRLLTRIENVRDQYRQELTKNELLTEEIKNTEIQIQKFPGIHSQLLEIEREKEQLNATYEQLDSEFRQATIMRSMNTAELDDRFTLVEKPEVPIVPVKPRKKLLAGILAILSLIIGLTVVFVRDLFDERLWSKSVLEKNTDKDIYLIPKFR